MRKQVILIELAEVVEQLDMMLPKYRTFGAGNDALIVEALVDGYVAGLSESQAERLYKGAMITRAYDVNALHRGVLAQYLKSELR